MRENVSEFFEEYKRLDMLCKQLLGAENGVTQYIKELEEVRGKIKRDEQLYIIWKEDYNQLIKMRRIRNRLAHEINAFDEVKIEESDIIWLKKFYRRIIELEDIFSMLNKRNKVKKVNKPNNPKEQGKNREVTKIILRAFLLALFILLILGIFFYVRWKSELDSQPPVSTEREKDIICVNALNFARKSRNEISLSWSDELDIYVDSYDIKRRDVIAGEGIGEWKSIAIVKSDSYINGTDWSYVDYIGDNEFKQYEYRVDVILAEGELNELLFEPIEGTPILASNVKVCIDPGHFNKPGEVTESDEYDYVEGNFMLAVALELKERLRTQYGIDVCLTRDSDMIEIDGYQNEELDSAHISLRGEYAAREDCDLFVSLHTNSNEENANGYETFAQPFAINKPIIILSSIGCESEQAVRIANALGTKLASVNYELGLANTDEFQAVAVDKIGEWTKEYNDGLNEIGTVMIRKGKKDPDYYGVLRGATNVGVPGMIIEHGFHSVQEVRKAAAIGDLKEVWANADACGIAYGFGFTR